MATRPVTLGGFLLQQIREGAEKGHFPTEPELFEKAEIYWPRWWRYPHYFKLDEFRSILKELRDLGLVKQAPNQEDSGFPQWGVGDSWKPPRDGDNRPPPNPPEQNVDGPDDGDGRSVSNYLRPFLQLV